LVLRTFYVFERDLTVSEGKQTDAAYVRWHRPEDLAVISRHHVTADYIETRIGMGARIAVAEIDGEPAGWRFFQPPPVPQTPCFNLHFAPDGIGGYAAFVLPQYRGRGLFTHISEWSAPEFASAGYRRVVSMVAAANAPSLRAHERFGDRKLLELRLVKFAGFKLVGVDGRYRLGRWSRRNRCDVHVP
jgi:GNAT superfamily N-acetyltransferase